MDTKSKKRKTAVSFAVFFLSVSLLIGNGALIGKQALYSQNWRDPGISGLLEQDYQNTKGFRSYMQERLADFLTMAAEDAGDAQEYHEIIRRNKNLLYRIVRNGKLLYSNIEEGQQQDSSRAFPEGYNFRLSFDGKKASVEKDGKELDIYGDGYYRGSGQWYVPGYQNFTADQELENIEVQMFAAQEPVAYSYVSSKRGTYIQADNRLHSLFTSVRQHHACIRMGMAGLAAGMLLAAVFLLRKPLRKGKKDADAWLAQSAGRIWFEAKLAFLFLAAAGLWNVIGTAAYPACLTGQVIYDADNYQLQETVGFADFLTEMDIIELDTAEENTQAYDAAADLSELGFAEAEESTQEQGIWPRHSGGWDVDWYQMGSSILAHPVYLLIWFWLAYLLVNDLRKNRRHFFNGFFQRVVHRARMDSIKQPFAVSQMRRFLVAAAAGIAAAAAGMAAAGISRMGFFNDTETAAAWLLILAALTAVLYNCLTRIKQQALELDLLAEHIQAVQSGDYTEKEGLPEDSCLKPLADSLNQIRQGMENAVGERLKSERMKVELVANVSHDLKTPLTSIISYLSFLKQEEDLPEHVMDYIRILDEKAQRLNSMVQDVFAVSKAASGQLPVEIKELDFGKLLRQTLADMDEQIQAGKVIMKTDIPQEPVYIHADGSRLYRVFQNLIQNALQYSLEGSRVFVNLKREGGYAAACIKNTSQQELRAGADFTERFVRGDTSRTDGGSGLGLSIAKSFTEACSGKFSLETDADLFVVKVEFRCLEEKEDL